MSHQPVSQQGFVFNVESKRKVLSKIFVHPVCKRSTCDFSSFVKRIISYPENIFIIIVGSEEEQNSKNKDIIQTHQIVVWNSLHVCSCVISVDR